MDVAVYFVLCISRGELWSSSPLVVKDEALVVQLDSATDSFLPWMPESQLRCSVTGVPP
jgi:hypothetical protein